MRTWLIGLCNMPIYTRSFSNLQGCKFETWEAACCMFVRSCPVLWNSVSHHFHRLPCGVSPSSHRRQGSLNWARGQRSQVLGQCSAASVWRNWLFDGWRRRQRRGLLEGHTAIRITPLHIMNWATRWILPKINEKRELQHTCRCTLCAMQNLWRLIELCVYPLRNQVFINYQHTLS